MSATPSEIRNWAAEKLGVVGEGESQMKRNSMKSVFRKPAGFGWKTGLVAMAFASFLSGPVFAQNSCFANINTGFGAPGPFLIGQPIPVELELDMLYSQGANYVDIKHFQHLLDCENDPGKDMADCILDAGQGNTVSFDSTSIWTDCKDAENTPGSAAVVSDQLGIVVDFFVDKKGDPPLDYSAIRIPNPDSPAGRNFCTVGFNVTVEGLSPANQEREVVELAGWTGADDAVCDNGAQSSTSEKPLEIVVTNRNTSFLVRKNFTDDNPTPVDVHIACNGGFISQEEFSITDPATGGTFPFVRFIVY